MMKQNNRIAKLEAIKKQDKATLKGLEDCEKEIT